MIWRNGMEKIDLRALKLDIERKGRTLERRRRAFLEAEREFKEALDLSNKESFRQAQEKYNDS